jgi:hypothetical protein
MPLAFVVADPTITPKRENVSDCPETGLPAAVRVAASVALPPKGATTALAVTLVATWGACCDERWLSFWRIGQGDCGS